MMRLGAVEQLFDTIPDDLGRFQAARRLGLHGLEIMLTRQQLRDGGRLDMLVEAKTASGLDIPSLMLFEHNGGGIASADEATAAAADEDVRIAVRWAQAVGARHILVPFFVSADLETPNDIARAIHGFARLLPEAEAHGVHLLIESTLPARDLLAMADALRHAHFGVYFDVANMVARGMDTVAEIHAQAPLIRQVHFKDTGLRPGDGVLGTGLVDYPACVTALRGIGYDGWVMLETMRRTAPLIARDIAFTKRLIPGISRQPGGPRLAVSSDLFDAYDPQALAAACRQYGVDGLMLEGALLRRVVGDGDAAAALRRGLDDAGVAIVALGANGNLAAKDETRWQDSIAFVRVCLEAASALGAAIVTTSGGTRHPDDISPSPENWRADARQRLFDALDMLLPAAQGAHTLLALEPHVLSVVRTQVHMAELADRFRSDYLQFVLSPYGFLWGRQADAAGFMRGLPARWEHRFVLAHAADLPAGGVENGLLPFGEGALDQHDYLDFLARIRPDLPVVLRGVDAGQIGAAAQRVRAVMHVR
jgi:sugar phosphate isomerase/epimerase